MTTTEREHREAGFSFVEAVIATALLIIVVLIVSTSIITNTQYAAAHHQKTQLTTLTALINSYVFGVNPDLHFYSSLNCPDDTTPQTDNLQLITPTDTSCVRVWGNSTYSELLETGGTITHPAQYVIEIEDPHLQTLTIYSSHTMSSETTPLTGANSETEN